MRELCGREVTITDISISYDSSYIIFSVDSGRPEQWNFISEMFEPAVDYCEIIKSGFELDDLF